jgi:hypothetical protein
MAFKLKLFSNNQDNADKNKSEIVDDNSITNDKIILKEPKVFEQITIINKNKMERTTNPYLNLISNMEDKNQSNIPQNEIIQKALNFNSYLINKVSGESITESRQLQYAMIKLFDNLEKLASNCDHYTNRYLIKRDNKKPIRQLNRFLLKRNKIFTDSSYFRLFIPKDLIN